MPASSETNSSAIAERRSEVPTGKLAVVANPCFRPGTCREGRIFRGEAESRPQENRDGQEFLLDIRCNKCCNEQSGCTEIIPLRNESLLVDIHRLFRDLASVAAFSIVDGDRGLQLTRITSFRPDAQDSRARSKAEECPSGRATQGQTGNPRSDGSRGSQCSGT
jgi:hypothetical protein